MKGIIGLIAMITFSTHVFAFSEIEQSLSSEIIQKFETSKFLNSMIDQFESVHKVTCEGSSDLVENKLGLYPRQIRYSALCTGKSSPLHITIYSTYFFDKQELVFGFQKFIVKKEN